MGILSSGARWLYAVIALLCAAVLSYSQTTTLDWDEGFHLVAASLIAAGKHPYLDFCFPQPALHAWWNAGWLNLTGGGWRGPHAVAALLTCGAMVLTADFVHRRYPAAPQVAACVAALLVGLNSVVVEFGTQAQAYGAGTFLTVAAFRASLARRPALAGCLAGASAGCSLLTAPASLVLLIRYFGQRQWRQAGAFVLGLTIPLIPLLIPFVIAPYPTWFNLVDYHVFYRHVGWTGATGHDLQLLSSWVNSGQALFLGLFSVAGLWHVRDSELRLAAWMALALGIEAAIAHPTFPQYFVFTVPFLAMVAAPGFCEIASRLSLPARWAVTAAALLLLLCLADSLVQMREGNNTWTAMESLARKIEQVTPANAPVLADPPVYFALRRLPPPGMEFPASHALELPATMAGLLHIVPQSVLERRVLAGEFATVETCKGDEDEIEALDLPDHYAQSVTIAGCHVYWGFQ